MISKIGDQCFSSEVRIDSSCETNIYRNGFFFLGESTCSTFKKILYNGRQNGCGDISKIQFYQRIVMAIFSTRHRPLRKVRNREKRSRQINPQIFRINPSRSHSIPSLYIYVLVTLLAVSSCTESQVIAIRRYVSTYIVQHYVQ